MASNTSLAILPEMVLSDAAFADLEIVLVERGRERTGDPVGRQFRLLLRGLLAARQ